MKVIAHMHDMKSIFSKDLRKLDLVHWLYCVCGTCCLALRFYYCPLEEEEGEKTNLFLLVLNANCSE